MVLPQALEYNWEFNKSLEQIGQSARERAMLQRKLDRENQEKIFQVYQSVSPAILYPKFNKLVVDQRLGGLQKRLSDYQKQNPNASFLDLQGLANQEVGEIAKQSAGITSAEESIDKYISMMDPKSPYDKARVRALSIDRALYTTDESGNKVLRSNFDGVNVDEIVSKVIEDNEDKLIDPFKGEKAMVDVVNDASLYTQNIEQTVETPNGRKTVVVGQKSSVPFFLEAREGQLKVKQQPNGYLDEGVFQRFYQDPSIRANINANAKSNMQKLGVPESPEAYEWFKRAYLTSWLDQNKKGVFEKVDKTLYQKPSGGSGGSGGGQPYRKAYEELEAAVKAGKFSEVSPTIIEYLTDVANKQGKRAAVNLKYTSADIDVREVNGKLKMYEKATNKEIPVTLNQRDFDQDYNKGAFGAQAAANASGVNWK